MKINAFNYESWDKFEKLVNKDKLLKEEIVSLSYDSLVSDLNLRIQFSIEETSKKFYLYRCKVRNIKINDTITELESSSHSLKVLIESINQFIMNKYNLELYMFVQSKD